MALARVDRLTFSYPDAAGTTLRDVSLRLEPGERVVILGGSGSGKSTLLRALAGLVPHFHGGRFAGRIEVDGRDTRRERPADLAGTVACVFQDPEDQIVMTRVEAEVAFGLENLGTPPEAIAGLARRALASVGAEHLVARRTSELSGGELQRVCLASALALAPRLLLLDEPTSQLDPAGAVSLFELLAELPCAVVCAEQRPARALEWADRVLFLDGGRLELDAPVDDALDWLRAHRPAFLPRVPAAPNDPASADAVCRLDRVAYEDRVAETSLAVGRGEIVALVGPNGSGKTTLAKLAVGLLDPTAGRVELRGRAAYLSQDPGRYLIRERVEDEVALGGDGDLARARAELASVDLGGHEHRHPRDLSSGERERLGLASVLVTEPDLLVLDEPTRGVDPERKDRLAELLRATRHDRATLVVTHDLVFAGEVADRLVSLDEIREPALA
ncbi:MAG: energy-coupling factor transport system ATP-binding protein [Gaiellaceae bacterium]|nr:energy-coupling factor transport system ATP-binding protein [Gaiellaceae bacterium]